MLLTIPLTGLRSNSPHKGSFNPSVSRIRHHPRRGLYLLTNSFHMWISRRHIGSGKSRKDWDRSPILLQTFGKWTDPGWSCVSSIKTKSQLMRKWIILMLNFCTTCWLPRIHILWHLGTYNKWGGRGVIFPKGPKACLSPVIFDYFLVPIPKILLNITWIREKTVSFRGPKTGAGKKVTFGVLLHRRGGGHRFRAKSFKIRLFSPSLIGLNQG